MSNQPELWTPYISFILLSGNRIINFNTANTEICHWTWTGASPSSQLTSLLLLILFSLLKRFPHMCHLFCA
jgi:hypothetical protein